MTKKEKKTMKKIIALVLALMMVLSLTACAKDIHKKSEGVMTYAEYEAAELDTFLTIEGFVQAKQSWWDNKATLYIQDKDGAYFAYEVGCREDVYEQLVEGQKVQIAGYKAEWAGEVEIMDATVSVLEGNWIAEATDVTAKLGTDELAKHMNQKVSFKGLTVAPSVNADGEEVAFLYNWDGSGAQGDDLYFNVSYNGATYNFCVEKYLTGADTEVYKTVEGLKVGDTIDCEGFLYWYEGVNPHITSVTVK